MIPKIIHFCWLSGDPYPKLVKKCIASWKKVLPDYEIMLWDRNRFDIESCQWVKQAFIARKYAFAADYIRCYALYNYGGIYLDSDVEVLKSFDNYLHLPYFLGYESGTHSIEAAVMGAEKGFPFLKSLIEYYDHSSFEMSEGASHLAIPDVMDMLIQRDGIEVKEISKIKDFDLNIDISTLQLFRSDFFSPIPYCGGKTYFSTNTNCIHHFQLSWWSETDRAINKLARYGKIGRILQNNIFVQKAIGFFYKKIKYYFKDKSYYIGLVNITNSPRDFAFKFKDIRWIKGLDYGRFWYADPFILSVKDKEVVILAEEWVRKTCKGRLALLSCKKKGRNYYLKKRTTILEKDTHLSFPYIVEDNSQIYILPENYESGSVSIYTLDSANKILKDPVVILNEELVDCQITKIGDDYYLFGIKFDGLDYNSCKKLLIYKSKNLLGRYELYQIIENPLKEERGAGRIFSLNGKLYRPAQSCEGEYGSSILIYELTLDKTGVFKEILSRRILPDRKLHYGLRHHTFDRYSELAAVDGYDFTRFFRIGRLLDK